MLTTKELTIIQGMMVLSFTQSAIIEEFCRFYRQVEHSAHSTLLGKLGIKALLDDWSKYQCIHQTYLGLCKTPTSVQLTRLYGEFKEFRRDCKPSVLSTLHSLLLKRRSISADGLLQFNAIGPDTDFDTFAFKDPGQLYKTPADIPCLVVDAKLSPLRLLVRNIAATLLFKLTCRHAQIQELKLPEKIALFARGAEMTVVNAAAVGLLDEIPDVGGMTDFTDKEPLSVFLVRKLGIEHECKVCHSTLVSLSTCARCRNDLYCMNGTCNKSDWKAGKHQLLCKG